MKLNEAFTTKETPSCLEDLTKEELISLSTKLFLTMAATNGKEDILEAIVYAGGKLVKTCNSPNLNKHLEASTKLALDKLLPLYHKHLTNNE